MRIVWFASPSDCEFDVTAAVARSPDVELLWYCFRDPLDVNHEFHLRQTTQADNICVVQFGTEEIEQVFTAAAKRTDADLMVIRHPTWLAPLDAKQAALLLHDRPLICWTWEWLPNIALHQMPPLDPWPRIAVTNHQDLQRCHDRYPAKQVLYFPFGAVAWTDAELQPSEQYQADLVCDAQPHAQCACTSACPAKQRSVEIMVQPIVDLHPTLWGNRYSQVWPCDWASMPEFAPYVRGTYPTREYPKVYASSKIYLGVSWNAPTGGYSIRLSRALSCGIATLWENTVGWRDDFAEYTSFIGWTENGTETRALVQHLQANADERSAMGQRGRRWVIEHWEWTKILHRLVKEII